jgi:hypothetical protein
MRAAIQQIALATLALMAAPIAFAAPSMTMRQSFTGGYWSLDYSVLDFFYTASPGEEFLNYRVTVSSINGAKILDPIKTHTFDQDSDAIETFANSVYSLFGLGPPTILYNAYRPIGLSPNNPAVALLDWSVADFDTGDSNSFDAGPPYGVVNAPFHLARVWTTPDFQGTVSRCTD